MMLLPEERAILYATYRKIASAGADFTDVFYTRLFEIDPALQSLFKTTMNLQGAKWRLTLNIVIAAIDNPASLRQLLGELGRRHVGYGVKDEDYAKLVEAVLWAMREYLGSEFTPQVEAAWRKLFSLVVDLTINDPRNNPV